MPLFNTRPKVNRAIALFVSVLILNVVGTSLIIALGVSLASIITGVPVFPPGARLPLR